MTVRNMTVVRTPGTDSKPMVKIANQLLLTMGFAIGVPIEVTYERGLISIRRSDNNYEPNNNLQTPSSPIAVSATPCADDAGEGDGHARRKQSDPADVAKVVPISVQPLRYVLTGHWCHDNRQNAGVIGLQMRIEHGR